MAVSKGILVAPKDRLTDTAVLNHANQPPITVAVVEQHHGVTFSGVGLALNRGDKRVQCVHELEIDVL